METEVLVGSLSFIGVLITALIGWFSTNRERHLREQSEAEMSLQMAALDFSDFLTEWHDTFNQLEDLMARSSIDRFLILRAWNGKLAPRWTTAIYQLRRGDQQSYSYVHFELDQDYVDRLRHVSLGGPLRFKTEEIPDCSIKQVYEKEGVVEALWIELEQRWMPGTESRAITYCSFSTHNPDGFSEGDEILCKIIAGRMKGIAMTFGSGD